MTRAKAADVAQALTNLGYACLVIPSPTGDVASGWKVQVQVSGADGVAASIVANFGTAQGVNAVVRAAEFN